MVLQNIVNFAVFVAAFNPGHYSFFRAIVDVDVDPLMRAKLGRVQYARGFLGIFCHNYHNYSMFRDVPECSGMFRDVPECSGMFRDVPCSWFYRRPLV